ncbi:MAG: PEP/pyruvate-binding domain-containing protein [Verrucomicrobiia bacterium]
MRFIAWPDNLRGDETLGGKAGALAALQGASLPIPPWFVLLPEAFDAGEDAWRAELADALVRLCPGGERVAVRSSAGDEDSAQHSFAGQLDSFLFVAPADVAGKAAAVWRSGFSERILAYRRERGLTQPPRPPAVLVQRMANADRAGVAFGADPVSGRRGVAVVAAVYGLGNALVAGDADADTWHVDRDGNILKREIVCKRTASRFDPARPEGVSNVVLPGADASQPALTDEQVRAVAELARQTGRWFGRPQDIEWAIEGGRLSLLQSRPITSIASVADPDGVLNLWDNSNIAESYSGVTTPLTFSFARRAYEEVYRQFCRLMGVPAAAVAAHDNTFRNMLGLIRGRVYYNLLNWYRMLALLPGFRVNRRFMEQMMGVKEGLPGSIVTSLERATWRDRLADSAHLALTVAGLIINHARLPALIRRFYRRLDDALAPPRPALEDMRPDELAAYYRGLEHQLLTRWDAPIVNDFFAMIHYGLLRRLAETWCGDPAGSLQNELLCGEGGIVSAEPPQRIREMARLAAADVAWVEALRNGPLPAIQTAMASRPEFRAAYEAYLAKFGDRCLDELKLESPTLHDDPLLLLRSVGELAQRFRERPDALPSTVESELRRRAEERWRMALARQPLRRALFRWVLRQARSRVRDRENLRFERTRLFGRVRRVFLEVGRRFHTMELIESPRDIFYIELDELLGFIEGTATTTDLRALVALRKAEFERHRQAAPPADRFETRGVVHHGQLFLPVMQTVAATDATERRGIGCCPGIVRGPVRVVRDPRNALLRPGEILVAERTDPGWVMLFPAAAALLVERGSLLSHSAIVAREMNIPAVVSIAGLTRWLRDGDIVEMNGSTGAVRQINTETDHAK